MDEVMELSCVTVDTDSWPWWGIPSADVSNCTQEYPQPCPPLCEPFSPFSVLPVSLSVK